MFNMLYSSKDLLYIVLSLCILWLTILFSWALYYVALMLRDGYRTFREVKEKLNLVDGFIKNLSERLEHTTSYLGLLAEGFGRVISFMQDRKETQRKKRKTE